jgi:hypothetical protein
MKDQAAEAEMIRRLKEIAADEDKYFPGVLGNPIVFASRRGMTLSKSFRNFKTSQKRPPEGEAPPKNGNKTARGKRPARH